MAELQFFATRKDHSVLVNTLVREFKAGFQPYASEAAAARPIYEAEQVLDLISAAPYGTRFCVSSAEWSREALQRTLTQRQDGRALYVANARYGGPSLDYIARGIEQHEGQSQLVPSSLGTFPTYYLAEGEVVRPSALDTCFSLLRRVVNRGGCITEVQGSARPGPLAMQDARVAYTAGCWLRVGQHHHVPRSKA